MTGLSESVPNFSAMWAWASRRIVGVSLTLPGLYTPWTLPNAAAIVKFGLTSISRSYAYATSSGLE